MYTTSPSHGASVPPHASAHLTQAQPYTGGIAPQQPEAVAAPAQHVSPSSTSWLTGVYEPSGDPSIDRMIRFEAACKRFGSLI